MPPAFALRASAWPAFALRASAWQAVVVLLVGVTGAQAQSLRERMLAAEDARASTPAEMAPLLQGLRASDLNVLAQAIRALGRFERPQLVTQLLPFIGHSRPAVRAEAVNALGQSMAAVPREAGGGTLPSELAIASKALFARLRAEPDPYVIGIVAETIGRLPFHTADSIRNAEEALATLLPVPEGAARLGAEPLARVVHPASVAGAVKGLETRIRSYQKLVPVQPTTIARLRGAATLGSDPSDTDFAFIRRVAWSALNAAAAVDLALVDHGLDDPDPQVRRLAVIALGSIQTGNTERVKRLQRALADQSHIVRYDAVRVYGRTLRVTSCAPLLSAIDDPSPHAAIAAVDALGDGCPSGPSPIARLIELIQLLATPKPQGEGGRPASAAAAASAWQADWHVPAHAFVAVARLAPDHAASRISVFAEHPVWQVRMYAARAAAAMKSESRLERLAAADPHDNVREAAIAGLTAFRGHSAGAIYIAALGRSDYQLLLTAANALKGSPNAGRAVPELIKALARVTAAQRDTSRDPRLAILERLRELGDKQHAPALKSCVTDFDPAVARACAETLTAWTGTPHVARPTTRSPARVVEAGARRVRISMRRGGAFDIQLFTTDAAATAARFVRLARQGYYNGLTFHRVVPNFVLQGGSPGANEYMGDGPFMRDEVGLRTHARGTLGISTRGRDTGDAQIFINLVDNPRLDHNYTVFAEITAGMAIVDRIIEGDVIERVDVLEPASTQSRR